ncbi:hypothetical protein K1719_010420 [Acacia pycnantha]|nr:hypothetical protein K1719_010420 [Acacia pycnantha]
MYPAMSTVDVEEARMKGEIGSKTREGETLQKATKIDAETKVIVTRRTREGQKEGIKVKEEVKIFENEREAEVAEANSALATKRASWIKSAQVAEVEASKAVALRETELQKEVETMNSLTRTEKLKAEFLYKGSVDYETKYLAITVCGIAYIKIAKKSWVFPWESCTLLKVSPVNYTFKVQAMSAEKLPFILPAVFTIGPKADKIECLLKYARHLSAHDQHSNHVNDLVQGVIEGETRVLAAPMTMEHIFKGTKEFKKQVFDHV